ncbi:glycosyltransferase [Streptomyces sp. SCL15-4]|uniref:glycosyltransferase n=1 Tax=Streptomyces sp. SCL15-4 TaxID=2967221 RepID=UPI002965DA29|nr:glycosyltransferase [Streptomyces sp. SCL15-4]
MREVPIGPTTLAPYLDALGRDRAEQLRTAADRTRKLLDGRTVWNVNSTGAGGGVAELLHSLVPLSRELGIDTRWLVIEGDTEFWDITKRLCTRLYGARGDDGALGPAESDHYRRVNAENAARLTEYVRPGDIVIVHESQPAGVIPAAKERGATVVWRSHVGADNPNQHTREGQRFVRPFVERADATVFLTARYVTDWAPSPRVIPPSIDPCAPKNMPLDAAGTLSLLSAAGIIAPGTGTAADATLPLTVPAPVGPPVTVRRPAVVLRQGPPPPASVPMVVQVSRWDRLKDMTGVLRAFVEADRPDAYLSLVGADVTGVCDDPEAALIFDSCRRAWEALPSRWRGRVQLVCLPMADLRENALLVNAIQQHASVVVQKSLAEGFGLTATEAMWKSRPLVASDVAGLREQVTDGEHGLLLPDPTDIGAAAEAIRRLLGDPGLAARLGTAARRRVDACFLPDRHLLDWARLFEDIVLTGEA